MKNLNIIDKNNMYNSLKDIYIMYLRKSRKDSELSNESDEVILKRHEDMLYSFAESLRYN